MRLLVIDNMIGKENAAMEKIIMELLDGEVEESEAYKAIAECLDEEGE